mgnify:CR=1 FL=1
MLGTVFNAIIFQPLYNGLIFLMDILPVWADAGVAVILFTVIIKLILFPLSRTSVSTQLKMKELQPKIQNLKERFKDDRQKQAEEMMKVYKEHNLNPFSGFLLILIQLPIIIALYWVFLRSGLPEINTDLLYSFVPVPGQVDMNFLGLVNIADKSYILALLAAVTSFFQIRFSMPNLPESSSDTKRSFKDDLARSMRIQMKYVFPIVIFFVAYSISGAVALYWTTSNMFTIGQELVIRKQIREPHEKARNGSSGDTPLNSTTSHSTDERNRNESTG